MLSSLVLLLIRIAMLKKLGHQFMGEQKGHLDHFLDLFLGIPTRNLAPIELGPVVLLQDFDGGIC